LKEVDWTPYRLVAAGEAVAANTDYMKITENSTLVSYDPNDEDNNWTQDTLNQLIYEVDKNKDAEKTTITNLDLLDLFLDEGNNLKNNELNYF
jgi:hypothetical protein